MSVAIHELLSFAVQHKASDIHLSAGEIPCVRIDGQVRRLELDALAADDAKRMAYSVMNERQKSIFERDMEIDFSIGLKGLARFRCNVYTHGWGIGMALRRIPGRVLTLDELEAPAIFKTIANYRQGLVLFTGPTGSGKSTTLAAMLHHINQSRHEHILTIEDPVEYVHVPDQCIITQREVGAHTRSFSMALRSALRQDIDVLLIGEMRDLETVSLALTAAETGHLVFGTLHTNNTSEAFDRIIDQYPHEQQAQVRTMLSQAVMAVVTQLLVQKRGGGGRIAVHEILMVNPAVRNLIRENKLFQIPSVLQAGQRDGMQTMEMCLKEEVAKRRITREEAIFVSNNPRLFEDDGLGSGGPSKDPRTQSRTRYT